MELAVPVEVPPPAPPPLPPAMVDPVLWVRAPPPGRRAPLNLRWIYLEVEPKPASMPGQLSLVSGTESVPAQVAAESAGQVLAELPDHLGPCRALCPSTRYHLELEAAAPTGPMAWVETATVVDLQPPVLTSTSVFVVGDGLEMDLFADEAIVARGDIRDRTGLAVPISVAPLAGPQLRLRPAEELPADRDVWWTIFTEDLAGNPGPTLQLAVHTPPRLDVRIQEVVSTALHDWGDSEGGGGVPFDPWPGIGSVSSADEWVELVNFGAVPIDLYAARLELRGLDGSPNVTPLAGAPALHFGSGGSRQAWWPGEALVARLRGDLSQRGLTLELWAGRRRLDQLRIGTGEGEDHPGGAPPDPTRESLARTSAGTVAWCAPTPGDPVPNHDCQ